MPKTTDQNNKIVILSPNSKLIFNGQDIIKQHLLEYKKYHEQFFQVELVSKLIVFTLDADLKDEINEFIDESLNIDDENGFKSRVLNEIKTENPEAYDNLSEDDLQDIFSSVIDDVKSSVIYQDGIKSAISQKESDILKEPLSVKGYWLPKTYNTDERIKNIENGTLKDFDKSESIKNTIARCVIDFNDPELLAQGIILSDEDKIKMLNALGNNISYILAGTDFEEEEVHYFNTEPMDNDKNINPIAFSTFNQLSLMSQLSRDLIYQGGNHKEALQTMPLPLHMISNFDSKAKVTKVLNDAFKENDKQKFSEFIKSNAVSED